MGPVIGKETFQHSIVTLCQSNQNFLITYFCLSQLKKQAATHYVTIFIKQAQRAFPGLNVRHKSADDMIDTHTPFLKLGENSRIPEELFRAGLESNRKI